MDKFEKFVVNHRDEFDVYEPNPDLWNRIRPSKPQKLNLAWLWKAAVIGIVFGLSYWVVGYIGHNKNTVAKTKDTPIPELVETEKYYNGLIKTKLKEVQPILSSYPELKSDIRSGIAELDSVYKELKKDLKDNISNEEIIEAMIQNYRLKIQLLEQIQQEFPSKKIKNKTHSHEI